MKTILFTGATGGLGGELFLRLIEQGHRLICLVRRNNFQTAYERIEVLGADMRHVLVLEGDICKPKCGIDMLTLDLKEFKPTMLVHVAADTRFNDSAAEEIITANYLGVINAFDLAQELGIRHVHHVSTAYVAGSAKAFSEGDLLVGQQWRNVYEHSKMLGEREVRRRAGYQERGTVYPNLLEYLNLQSSCSSLLRRVKYSIYRPSIIVGRETDGGTQTYDAYFRYGLGLHFTAEGLRARAQSDKLPQEVSVRSDGFVTAPFVVTMPKKATLNLIPVDWCAAMLTHLIQIRPTNLTYHVVNPRPPLVRDLLAHTLAALRMGGIRTVESDEEKEIFVRAMSPRMMIAQKAFTSLLKAFNPYVTGEADFGFEMLPAAFVQGYQDPRAIDKTFVRQMMLGAVANNFGQKKEEETETA